MEGGETLERLTPVDQRTDRSHPRVNILAAGVAGGESTTGGGTFAPVDRQNANTSSNNSRPRSSWGSGHDVSGSLGGDDDGDNPGSSSAAKYLIPGWIGRNAKRPNSDALEGGRGKDAASRDCDAGVTSEQVAGRRVSGNGISGAPGQPSNDGGKRGAHAHRTHDPLVTSLLAAAMASRHTVVRSPASASWGRGRGELGGTPGGRGNDNDDACILFDPPSISNGLKGLSTQEIDRLLLGVDATTVGSKTCWRNTPQALEWSQLLGDKGENVSGWASGSFQIHPTLGAGKTKPWRGGKEGGRAFEKMRKVIRAPRTAKELPPSLRNR